MKTLRIDGKWSVEFDPDSNDRPEKWKSPEHAMYHALLSEYESSERWKANMRDMHSALGAMRNAINEHVPMPSMESDLLEGPEPAVFAEKVATAVCAEIERLRAKLAEAERVIGRSRSALKKVNRIVSDAALTGFNYWDGDDWPERLYASQQSTSRALRAAAEWMEKGDD